MAKTGSQKIFVPSPDETKLQPILVRSVQQCRFPQFFEPASQNVADESRFGKQHDLSFRTNLVGQFSALSAHLPRLSYYVLHLRYQRLNLGGVKCRDATYSGSLTWAFLSAFSSCVAASASCTALLTSSFPIPLGVGFGDFTLGSAICSFTSLNTSSLLTPGLKFLIHC